MTRKEVLKIKTMRNEGKTNDEIAKHFDCSPVTITRWVKKLREAGHEVKRFKRGRTKLEL